MLERKIFSRSIILTRSQLFLMLFLSMILIAQPSFAEKIYRCGNTYTNTPRKSQKDNCTIINANTTTITEISVPQRIQRSMERSEKDTIKNLSNKQQQTTKVQEARLILEAELKQEQEKIASLHKEYNNGEPEKMGPEHKNYQKYLDRIEQLKTYITNTKSNIDALERELSRLDAKNQ